MAASAIRSAMAEPLSRDGRQRGAGQPSQDAC
jgi:hypothetical protein